MTAKPVDRGIVSVWRWNAMLGGFVPLVAAGVPLFTARIPLAAAVIAEATLLAAILAWIAWYPAARYRHLAWRLEPGGIFIRDGVFFRHESFVARTRIQHTDVSQGPLQRHYGVAELKLYTAGSRFTKIELPGLAHGDALALRDELQREGSDDAV
ncbi:MAG TPA: PH domain-containing protein [Gammaproteobacteria bacterium]